MDFFRHGGDFACKSGPRELDLCPAPMQTYNASDIERILRLSRSTLRSLIRNGFVKPARGARRELRFSFQDLIVLRAARALIEAKIPRRRINKSLQELRRHLPEEAPLSGLSISASATRSWCAKARVISRSTVVSTCWVSTSASKLACCA